MSSSKYNNDIELINATLAAAIENNLIDFAEGFYAQYKQDIFVSCNVLKMTLYKALRSESTSRIDFAIKIGIPFDVGMTRIALKEACSDVFKSFYNAFPEKFEDTVKPRGHTETMSYASYALTNKRSDIAEFLISKGIGVNEQEYHLDELIIDLNDNEYGRIKASEIALRNGNYTKESLADIDFYAEEIITSALIKHDNEDLLKLIADTPAFTDIFYSQNSINAAYEYGYMNYLDFYRSEKGAYPLPTKDEITGKFKNTDKFAFVNNPELLANSLIRNNKDTEYHINRNLLMAAIESTSAECVRIICQQTAIFDTKLIEDKRLCFRAIEILQLMIEIAADEKLVDIVFDEMSADFLEYVNEDAFLHAWKNILRHTGNKKFPSFDVEPVLTAWLKKHNLSECNAIPQNIIIDSLISHDSFGINRLLSDDVSQSLIKNIRYLNSTCTIVAGRILESAIPYTPFDAKSEKQSLALMRKSHKSDLKRNWHIMTCILTLSDDEQIVKYMDAFAGKDISCDPAFKMACKAWNKTPMDLLALPINKKAKNTLLSSFA